MVIGILLVLALALVLAISFRQPTDVLADVERDQRHREDLRRICGHGHS